MDRYTRSITMLGETGDTTLCWTEDRDDAMVELIRLKQSQGILFFTLAPNMGGMLPPTKKPLKDAEEVRKHHAVAVRDEDFARFVEAGTLDVIKTPAEPIGKPVLERDAKKIAKSRSVAAKPLRGG